MSTHLLLASTSTVYGSPYLSYLKEDITRFFQGKSKIVFIPYARPGGVSWEDYTAAASEVFSSLGFEMKGIHEWPEKTEALKWADGFFTGGGNTFVLLKTLQEEGLIPLLKDQIKAGKPYLGTSAGSNIAGQTISTTNDMPIVYPHSFDALQMVPFNINPHYLDPIEGSTHMGETRETRINEFHCFNDLPVAGLREGTALEIHGEELSILGEHSVRVFRAGKKPVEVSSSPELTQVLGLR